MAAHGNPNQVIAQMHQELEFARGRIDALSEQSRRAADEIARLRNTSNNVSFVQQNGPGFIPNAPGFNIPGSSAPGFIPTAPWIGAPPPPPPNGHQYGPPRGPPQGPPSFTFPQFPLNQPNQPQQFAQQTMPYPNGGTAGSSQNNGFPNHSSTPVTANNNGVNSQDPVAQKLKMLEEQSERVLSLLAKLPGAAVPVDVEPRTGYQASPFIDEIALVDVPKKYNIPTFTPKYSGTSDPTEHIAQYKQMMWTVSIPYQYQEVCMCKSFGATLTGAALQWLINLKPKTVGSFAN